MIWRAAQVALLFRFLSFFKVISINKSTAAVGFDFPEGSVETRQLGYIICQKSPK